MSDRKKHRTANEYLQYLKGELTNRERHSFERKLEADPFDQEAMEGLEMLTTDQAEEDILSLHGRIRKRLGRKRRIAWYRVAASIASLLVIGTIFIKIYDFNPKVENEVLDEELFAPGKSGDSESVESVEMADAEEPEELQELQESKRTEEMKEIQEPQEQKIRKEPMKAEVRVPSIPVAKTPAAEVPDAGKSIPEDLSKNDEPERIMQVEAEARPQEVEVQYDHVVTVAEAAPQKEVTPDTKSERRARKSNKSLSQPVVIQAGEMKKMVSSKEDLTGIDSEQVRGIVISEEDMEPIEGAAVAMKGSNTGVVTNRDGIFSLPVEDDSNKTIVASFVGMETQEYQFDKKSNIQLVMRPDPMMLDEVVVVGQGMQPTEAPAGASPAVKLGNDKPGFAGSAQPSVGTAAFKHYIEANLQFPEVESNSDREVVVLKFTVTTEGEIKEITSLRSPGEPFTEEAIRLLNEGPSWIPARDENGSIEEIVRLRIVFKR